MFTTPSGSQKVGGLRAVAPISLPDFINHQVVLALRPGPEETRYVVRMARAEMVAGHAQRARVQKTVGLRVAHHGAGLRLTLRTQHPHLQKSTLYPFDEVLLVVAELYADLVFDADPTGRLRQLVNHEEVGQQWQRLRQELAHRYAAMPDDMLARMVARVDQQLAQPAGLWPSLRPDYLYAALPGDFYQQLFETNSRYTQAKVFPQFLGLLDLHFVETLRLAPPESRAPGELPTQAVLQLTGALDPTATDVPGVAAAIQAALGRTAPVVPEEVQFAYEATHCFDRSTGRPVAVKLTVSCTYQNLYHREYYLTIQAEPAV